MNEARGERRETFRSRPPDPSVRLQIGGKKGDKYAWKLTPDWPVQYVTAWYAWTEDGCEHGGGGNRVPTANLMTVTAGFKQEGDELRIIEGTRDGHDGDFRGSNTTWTTSVPSESQFQIKALQDERRVGRDYTVLLEGRFVKGGKVVKGVIVAIRAVNRNDKPRPVS